MTMTPSRTTASPETVEPLPDAPALRRLADQSHRLIVAEQHIGGAYPASPTFSAYAGYAWLRDGSFTAEGVSRYGDTGSAGRFHDWACGVLAARAEQVAELLAEIRTGRTPARDRMLPTRFTLDGRDGTDPWWDFQTDGFGMWLWAVTAHARRHGLDLQRWGAGIEVCTDYLSAVWDLPCFDWWEENVQHRHVSTLSAVACGLRLAADTDVLGPVRRRAALDTAEAARELVLRHGLHDGHLAKWLGSERVDGSLAACIVPFGLVEPHDQLAAATLRAVRAELEVDSGVHRYAADVFYGGGQWPLLTALLGWNLAVAGDRNGAVRCLRWIAAQADADGRLPEQVDHHLLHPDSRAEGITRWGPVASPLLWSSGMYLVLAHELGLRGDGTAA